MRKQLLNCSLIAGLFLWSATAIGQSYTIGANNGYNTTTSYPTPFGDYYKTQRAQYLYLASELTGAGMVSGDITALSFTVALPYDIIVADGGVMEGYTVKIMTTATTSLTSTGWEEGATVVWGPTDYIPAEGVNTFTFDSPFSWDGSTNIIVEICGGIPAGTYEDNASVIWTTGLPFNGSRTFRSDTQIDVCGYTGTSFVTGTQGPTRPQIIFDVLAGADCAGTPEAGDASAAAESVCPATIFNVSVAPILEGGITYQWENSTDGAIWNPIAGATSATYGASQDVPTWYHCVVTCTATGESSTSSDVYVGINAPDDCYCTPNYTTGTGDGDYISNVSLGAINNATGPSDSPFYTYYDGLSTDLEADATYTISITNGEYEFNNGVAAWIDFNHDGYFDEATEKLGEVTGLGAYGVGAITFTVPAGAELGTTRLRTREVYNTIGMLACTEYVYGETEDYNVNITPSACPLVSDLYVDGITTDDAMLHWTGIDGADQYRLILWNTATGLINKKGVNSTSYALVDNLTPLTTYAFRIKTVCYDEGLISSPTEWIYWTTLGRIGEEEVGVSLFPNPNNGTFTINVSGYENNAFTLNVVNAIGQVVYAQPVDINSNEFTETISLENVTPGMYQVNLSNASHNINYSIIITE